MRVGLDTNVLVYTHLATTNAQRAVRSFVLGLLADQTVTIVLTPLVLHEFVHVITDPRRFEPPVAMAEAIALARLYLERPNTDVVPVTEQVVEHALYLLEKHQMGRNRIADALVAAALIENGVSRMVTCNARDYGFAGLETVDPCAD